MQTETLPYAQIPRNFWGPDSPFLAHKRDAARKVIECLIFNAKFTPDVPIVDIVRMSIRRIAEISMSSVAAVRRALVWLEAQGFLSIITKDPIMTIRLLGKAHPYLYKREVKKANRHTSKEPDKEPKERLEEDQKDIKPAHQDTETGTPETGTSEADDSTKPAQEDVKTGTPCESGDKSVIVNENRDLQNADSTSEIKTGTPHTQTGTPQESVDNSASHEKDCEKNTAGNGSKTKPAQQARFSNREIIRQKKREDMTSPLSSLTQESETPKQAHPKPAHPVTDRKTSRATRKQERIEREYDSSPGADDAPDERVYWTIANAYAVALKALSGLPGARLPVRRFKDDFRRLQSHYGLSLQDLQSLAEARWTHPYWSKIAAHPWTLTQRYGNSDDPWSEIYRWLKNKGEAPKGDPRNASTPWVDENGQAWCNGAKVISSKPRKS